MLDSITGLIKKFVGNKADRDMRENAPVVEEAAVYYEALKSASNDQLRARTVDFKRRIAEYISVEQEEIDKLRASVESDYEITDEQKERIYERIDKLDTVVIEKIGDILNEIMPEAFAVVKETCRRFNENEKIVVTATEFDRDVAARKGHVEVVEDQAVWHNKWMAAGNEIKWDMVHYDCQLIGGKVLHDGKIAEMATGEGKTLVATLPVYLNALPGRGVHLVTVNNYLAKRDSEWMGPIFEFHGLSIDCIDNHQPNSEGRRKAYLADITYGTNNEFGFDYLRDNMAMNPEDLVQRKHNYAIVDEVDSVLIDEARTPLIISGPTPKGDQHQFNELKPKVEKLVKAQRQFVTMAITDAKKQIKQLEEGSFGKKEREALDKEAGLNLLRSFRGLPKNKALIKYMSEEGVKTYLQKTENIYLADNQKLMPEVDKELYFVIDEKNNSVELSEKGIDLIADSAEERDFFILPDIGAELADIERSDVSDREKAEQKDALMRDYTIKSERIHTINQLLKAYALFEKDVEYVIIDKKIKIVDEQTGRMMEGRRYSDGLHQAIEAKENVHIEAATQTYATVTLQNYFRMYNKLAGMTGTAETEAGELWEIYKLDVVVIPTNKPVIRDDRDDLVYKTKREKYNAVINEVQKLVDAGRPVLVGTTSVEVSELLSRMLKLKGLKHQVLNAKLHQKEADIVAEAGLAGTITIATNMAGRGTDIKLGPGVREAGGLAIIGTERHESRRVDRQLRGRSGRQGDPGASQFFVSLEDNLMRLFGSERIARLMDRMGLEEGEVIQHSMISKSIERAQRKVEENHFGIRKRLLEYDDVMNNQREVVYKKRRHALRGDRLSIDIAESMGEVSEVVVADAQDARDYELLKMSLIKYLNLNAPFDEEHFIQSSVENLAETIYGEVRKRYTDKCKLSAKMAWPVIKDVYEKQHNVYKTIAVPFTDGLKTIQVITDLERAYQTTGRELIRSLEKNVTLAMIDMHWKEHLREMDELRTSVQQAVYEQKDPLLIYKFESYELFKHMRDKVNKEIVQFLIKAALPSPDANEIRQAEQQRTDLSKLQTTKEEYQGDRPSTAQDGTSEPRQRRAEPVRVEKKVGRNDPCPCGSGKKYKQCHGRNH